MTTITIEIADEKAQQLAEEARHLHMTTEALATRKLLAAIGEPEQNFQDIARQVIQENAELYRRLA